MNQATETVYQAALALPPENRADLAEKLLDSLSERDQPAIDAAWVQEAERRLQAFDRGKIKALPGEEVMRSLDCLSPPGQR
jgi:putative addiction module component (TIGR02574 family)